MVRLVPLMVVIIIVHIALIFNASLAFGTYEEIAKTILITYLLAVAAITAIFDVKPMTSAVGFIGLQAFLIGFILTSVVLLLISPIFTSQIAGNFSTLITAAGFGFLYAFVIAFDEELIFRDLLPKKLHIPDIIAQPIFGLMHAAALTAILTIKMQQGLIAEVMFVPLLLTGFVILTTLGFIWAFMRDRMNIYASTGSHFAYNLFTYGILFSLIGVGG